MLDISKILIPREAKEGDVLEFVINNEETEIRKKEIEELTKDMWK